MTKLFLGVLLAAVFLVVCTNAQSLQSVEDFLRLAPLQNTKTDVETAFGKGSSANNPYVVTYRKGGLRITVDYALGDCRSGLSPWNVPEWTITEITYSFLSEKPKLKRLLRNRKQFRTRQAGDVLNHIEYYDDIAGVSVLYDTKVEGVMDIVLRPAAARADTFECPEK